MKALDLLGKIKNVQHVVFIAHPDDELIGMYELFAREAQMAETNPPVTIAILPNIRKQPLPDTSHRHQECEAFHKTVRADTTVRILGRDAQTLQDLLETDKPGVLPVLWFPDPAHEVHPEHIRLGNIHREVYGENVLTGFYSINMQAPYIYELTEEKKQQKKEWLHKAYPSQKGYFATHAECWMFEGRILV